MKKQDQTYKKLIAGIIIGVGLLVAVLSLAAYNYSNKLKSISINIDSPKNEDSQKRYSMVIRDNGCEYEITNLKSNSTEKKDCTVIKDGFSKIQSDFNKYSVLDKLQTASYINTDGTDQGGVYTFVVELNNGDQYKLVVNNQFLSSVEPFLNTLGLNVPKLSDLGLVGQY